MRGPEAAALPLLRQSEPCPVTSRWRLLHPPPITGATNLRATPRCKTRSVRVWRLLTPSLVALWLSKLIVFAVYPRFDARQHDRPLPAWLLAVAATAFAVNGLWAAIEHSGAR